MASPDDTSPVAASRLERVAESFDELYSDLTVLQRRLIAATRGDVDRRSEQELIDEASAILAAVNAARRAIDVGGPSARELEAAALARRVLNPPVDAFLLTAALRAQARGQAYPLLSAALRMSASDMPEKLAEKTLCELLAAPRSMGDWTARALLGNWQIAADTRISDLSVSEIETVCDRIEDAAVELPPEARHARGQRPAAPADGSGAGDRVLSSWVDASGLPADGIRGLAAATAQREGWPEDAAPVALMLAEFTHHALLPGALDEVWQELSLPTDTDERISALRAQSKAWWSDEEHHVLSVLLRITAELLAVEKRLRQMNGDYTQTKGGQTAMALSRAAGRRCGEILSFFEEDTARKFLEQLPRT